MPIARSTLHFASLIIVAIRRGQHMSTVTQGRRHDFGSGGGGEDSTKNY